MYSSLKSSRFNSEFKIYYYYECIKGYSVSGENHKSNLMKLSKRAIFRFEMLSLKLHLTELHRYNIKKLRILFKNKIVSQNLNKIDLKNEKHF